MYSLARVALPILFDGCVFRSRCVSILAYTPFLQYIKKPLDIERYIIQDAYYHNTYYNPLAVSIAISFILLVFGRKGRITGSGDAYMTTRR